MAGGRHNHPVSGVVSHGFGHSQWSGAGIAAADSGIVTLVEYLRWDTDNM